MENQIAFTLNDGAYWLSIIVGILGIVVIAGAIWFGREIFTKSSWRSFDHIDHFIHEYFLLQNRGATANELKAIVDSYFDHREKRNEFWTVYGQIILTIFVVVILAILLITKTITAEAGLPILSAVSGFAIAKGINSNKNSPDLLDPNDKGEIDRR